MSRQRSPHRARPVHHAAARSAAGLLLGLVGLLASFAIASAGPAEPPRGSDAPAAAGPAQSRRPVELFLLVEDYVYLSDGTMNGQSSLDAVREGVLTLLEGLDPQTDRAALVAFGYTAETLVRPSADWQAIDDGLRGIDTKDQWSRLDLAYLEVHRMLDREPADGDTLRATLTLTSGPDMPAPELARPRAEALRDAYGVRHFVITVGNTAEYALLRQIAEPEGLWNVAWGGDLIGAYREAGSAIEALAAERPPSEPMPVYLPRLVAGW